MKLEELPLATNSKNDKPLAHRYCTYCYPEVYPGIVALCGWVCKGILMSEEDEICIVCTDLMSSHEKICSGRANV